MILFEQISDIRSARGFSVGVQSIFLGSARLVGTRELLLEATRYIRETESITSE